jgi:hypothetical protein
MGAREIATEIEIDAPPARVWGVLVDTPRYPQWNPFIVELQGELSAAQEIKFSFRIPPAPRLPGRATVLKVVSGVELRWAGRLLWPWLFRAEHYHLLVPVEGGRTRLEHGEIFSGLAAALAWPLLRVFAQPGYARFNQALRERVEHMQPRSAV